MPRQPFRNPFLLPAVSLRTPTPRNYGTKEFLEPHALVGCDTKFGEDLCVALVPHHEPILGVEDDQALGYDFKCSDEACVCSPRLLLGVLRLPTRGRQRLFGHLPLGNILVGRDPSAGRHTPVGYGDGATVGSIVGLIFDIASGDMLGNVRIDIAVECAGCFTLLQQLAQRAAGLRLVRR